MKNIYHRKNLLIFYEFQDKRYHAGRVVQTTLDLFYLEKICEYFLLSYDELLLEKKKEKQSKFPVILTFLFVMMIIISFFLPHSTEDFAGSAVIITPAGFCLFAGCIGLLFSLYLSYRNHRS